MGLWQERWREEELREDDVGEHGEEGGGGGEVVCQEGRDYGGNIQEEERLVSWRWTAQRNGKR